MRIMQDLRSSLLRSQVKKSIPSHLRLRARIFLLAAVFLSLLLSPAGIAFAGSATWNLNPGNGDWNSATNWTPATIPNGDSDIATFEVSNITGVGNYQFQTTVAEIVFQPGASAFSIRTNRLLIINQAITNNSGVTQNFVIPAQGLLGEGLAFSNTATAGSATTFTLEGETQPGCTDCLGGLIQFGDSSSADNATFICNGGTRFNAGGGTIRFFETSSAGNATFTNNGARSAAARGGSVTFFGRSTASNGTFINKGATVIGSGSQPGGTTLFVNISHAANATLIARGQSGKPPGAIQFTADSRGGMARVAVSGIGNLNISTHLPPGVVVGSIEGNGMIFLGANNLTVGTNNRDTTFIGVIQDGDSNPGGGTGGSLTKVRAGTLILGNANTYTGGTTINGGKLVVNNTRRLRHRHWPCAG